MIVLAVVLLDSRRLFLRKSPAPAVFMTGCGYETKSDTENGTDRQNSSADN